MAATAENQEFGMAILAAFEELGTRAGETQQLHALNAKWGGGAAKTREFNAGIAWLIDQGYCVPSDKVSPALQLTQIGFDLMRTPPDPPQGAE